MLEQQQRRAVGPVEVIDDKERAGRACELRGGRVEQRVSVAVRTLDQIGEPRHAERLGKWLVRRQRLRIRASVEDRGAVAAGRRRELGRKPRLADAGLARDQPELGRSAPRAGPRVTQALERLAPANERAPSAHLERRRQRRRASRPGAGAILAANPRRPARGWPPTVPRAARPPTSLAAAQRRPAQTGDRRPPPVAGSARGERPRRAGHERPGGASSGPQPAGRPPPPSRGRQPLERGDQPVAMSVAGAVDPVVVEPRQKLSITQGHGLLQLAPARSARRTRRRRPSSRRRSEGRWRRGLPTDAVRLRAAVRCEAPAVRCAGSSGRSSRACPARSRPRRRRAREARG